MTQLSKQTLTALFETGDVPSGTEYANLIDSYVNQVETGVQSMAGALNPTELITARVSATNVNVTGTLTAVTFSQNVVSAGSVYSDNAFVSAYSGTRATFLGNVSAAVVYADIVRAPVIYQGVGIVSAAGTAQGTAAVLVNAINRGKGIVDGATTGFTPPTNNTGLTQYLFNEGASANLWPPVGGTINGLAVNAAFPLAASAMVTIVHITASAMIAK